MSVTADTVVRQRVCVCAHNGMHTHRERDHRVQDGTHKKENSERTVRPGGGRAFFAEVAGRYPGYALYYLIAGRQRARDSPRVWQRFVLPCSLTACGFFSQN